MSEADSYLEQMNIEALLASAPVLASLRVAAAFRGVTESEVDLALGGTQAPGGKLGGAILIVGQPEEAPDKKDDQIIVLRRIHTVRVIESVKVNRRPQGGYVAGMNADAIKDEVIRRLHMRCIGRAPLMLHGVEPFEDGRGGYGWDVKFSVLASLAGERRAAIGGSVSGGTVTLRCAAGGSLYYTTNGTAPIPGAAGVAEYSAPFAADEGTVILASATEDGKQLSDFLRIAV